MYYYKYFIGETLPTQLTHKLRKYLLSSSTSTNQSRIWNHYGPAEITIGCTYHLVDATCEHSTVPIGSMAPGYRGIIVDTFGEPVFIGQEGELLVGGVGVFAGYLKRDDLTKNALVDICGEWFYRSGDLVRMNNSSLIHYVGRKDHQVKLRGQRIELGEIERCLLSVSSRITGAVVVKWGENHLIAYVQSDSITADQLQEYCRSHLASFMVPSMFIVLEQFPLNANGKLDRKRLPQPDFSLLTDSHDEDDQMPLTPLEEQLLSIFAQAFHVNSPNVNVSFGQLGGTSLDAVTALSMIRQQVYGNVGIGVLYDNPSIRQLARVLEPLINAKKEVPIVVATTEIKDNHHRPTPSLLIEALGMVLLMCQWLLPFWIAYYSKYCFSVLLVPVAHLLSYIICQRLLLWPDKQVKTSDTLYSWRYYRWWYLERLWSINNSYWLKHILGTPIYNVYLRLCGARIGRGVHIYSTFIDAPWLLEVGDSTFIDGETILSNLSYHDQTYELHPICIGTYCSIGMFCVLYGDVNIPDNVYVESMSTVTGCYSSTKKHTMIYDRSFSWKQIIYQCICLFCLIIIHSVILIRTYSVYQYLLTFGMPIPIALAMSWLFWSIASLLTVTFFLKFIVGSVTPGNYPINSYYFLHRLWLRQLIICSFHRSYDILSLYDANANALLRWLGADIEDDVKLCQFKPILHFPSNLLKIERGVTTFAKVVLAPFEITLTGHCYVNTIVLGSDSNLANGCILMPRTKLAAKTMVGNLTLVKQDTSVSSIGSVLLGIPARQMPFVMPEVETQTTGNTSSSIFSSLHIFAIDCMIFLICKCLFITTYWLLPTILGPFVHIGFFCFMHRCLSLSVSSKMTFTYSETINRTRQLLTSAIVEFNIFVSPFLSQTQYLVFLFRALGARIGQDVILPTTDCLTDPPLVTIGDHVRLHREAWLQVTRQAF
jgi:acetyltransferase-like isoleucine patch superfamily enzyme